MKSKYTIRIAEPNEFERIGQLMVSVYSQLEGFPNPDEQPAYYDMLRHIGTWSQKPKTELLVAVSVEGGLHGAVVLFYDMQYYGSGGSATQVKDAAGFRLLAVDHEARGKGLGRLLTQACIDRAMEAGIKQVVIHTTKSMETAWGMYERMGFRRSTDLDFMQGELPVFGFRLELSS